MKIHLNDTQTTRYLSELEKGFRATGFGLAVGQSDRKLTPASQRVLAHFDRQQEHKLAQESARFLSEGTVTGNLEFPAGLARGILKEVLADSRVLEVCEVLTDPKAQATTSIPYEVRRRGSPAHMGVVPEGAEIPMAGISQYMDLSYIHQIKLALKVSNEALFFSRKVDTDWDAWSATVRSNAALVGELVRSRILNEMARFADTFQAVAVEGENLTSRLDGNHSLVKLAHWPLVKPHQERDLRGVTIGQPECPVTLVLDGDPIPQWDGSGHQAAGLYWKAESWNTGLIRVVNQDGDPQTPDPTTAAIDYHYSSNVAKFDLVHDPAISDQEHMNSLIRLFGAVQAQMMQKRFFVPNFCVMSPILNNQIADAPMFFAANARSGVALGANGDLLAIKQIGCWSTNAPSDLRDGTSERVVIGEMGTVTYTVGKAFAAGTPFEELGPNRLPTGCKVSYGEEYSAIAAPVPIRNRLTSIITWDSEAREAAV